MMLTFMVVHTSQGGTRGICAWWDWREGFVHGGIGGRDETVSRRGQYVAHI